MPLTDISVCIHAVIGQAEVQVHPKLVLGLIFLLFVVGVGFVAALNFNHQDSTYKTLTPPPPSSATRERTGPIVVTSRTKIGQRLTDALAAKSGLRVVQSDGTTDSVRSARAVVAPVDHTWRGSGPSQRVQRDLAQAFGADVPVVPVLIDQAPMPTNAKLSLELHQFTELHHHQVRSSEFDADVDVLARVLRKLPSSS